MVSPKAAAEDETTAEDETAAEDEETTEDDEITAEDENSAEDEFAESVDAPVELLEFVSAELFNAAELSGKICADEFRISSDELATFSEELEIFSETVLLSPLIGSALLPLSSHATIPMAIDVNALKAKRFISHPYINFLSIKHNKK